MKAGLKSKWIAALRSGQYTQGRGSLRAKNITGQYVYCALGVLQDVRDPSTWEDNHYFFEDSSPIMDLAEDELDYIVNMNDIEQRSFHEIADWIEENM